MQALPSAVRAQGSLPRLEERSAVLAEPPVGQPALQTLPSVARVEGVPSNATPSNSHKYLIETNPALTELKQFLNSDYLLGGLGINPTIARSAWATVYTSSAWYAKRSSSVRGSASSPD